jgi:two-component system cell cycle sensor histidine kinase/response regulator CckA
MASGLAWSLVALALVAGLAVTLALRAQARSRLLAAALDALPVSAQLLHGPRVVATNATCRRQFADAFTPLPDLLRRQVDGEVAGQDLTRLMQSAEGGRTIVAVSAPKGEPAWWEVTVQPVLGAAGHALWLCRDITAEHRAEQALRPLVQVLERPPEAGNGTAQGERGNGSGEPGQSDSQRLEAQLAQTLRLRAVGQLAGGIAHDFNNLLTVMIGFCDLLLLRHRPGDPSYPDIMQIRQNANRAAMLVRQLLAYSRRQTLQPQVVCLIEVLSELAHLLRRLIGSNIDLKLEHGRDLNPVLVDPGQLEQVVINLVVNARDAMPNGGMLTIRTANLRVVRPVPAIGESVPAGEYVQIDVIDTGTGIAPDIIDRIFEPFFSTKRVGVGTGLGLATVYGIVKQSGGYLAVDSTVGRGTDFRIYLPCHPERVASPVRREPEEETRDLTGTGTILLVEDEEAVRLFSARALRNKGYKVIEARNGRSALDIMNHTSDPIDLLITDVVMPEIDGPALVEGFRAARPGLKVIFISGYVEASLTAVGSDVHFLAKPFSLKQLASKVKEVLAEAPPVPATVDRAS